MNNKDFFLDLSKEERDIIVNKGTEPPFTGKYNDHFEPGIFICRHVKILYMSQILNLILVCGWPSFDDEIIELYQDMKI